MEILKVNRINFLLWGEASRRGWSRQLAGGQASPAQPSHISDMTVTPPAGCRGRGRPIVSAVRGVWPGYETWNMNRVEPTNKTAKLRPAAPRPVQHSGTGQVIMGSPYQLTSGRNWCFYKFCHNWISWILVGPQSSQFSNANKRCRYF